jgi:hypothetical protein
VKSFSWKRELPIDEGYDVVVTGGGPAGVAAAVSAARLGARVLLVEATGCLGGMGTSGLVTAFDPMSDGKRMLVGGLMREIVETMYERKFLAPYVTPEFWNSRYHQWVPFNAEGLKIVLDELVVAAGVEVRFFTKLIDVDAEDATGVVRGIIINSVEGNRYVPGKTFIDATGDAILSDLCNVGCREAGRDTSDIMPPTLCALWSGIDWLATGKSTDGLNPRDQQTYLEKAIEDGFFSHRDRHLPGVFHAGRRVGMVNAGHVFHMDALNTPSLSAGMMKGRKLVFEYLDFYRKYVPGFAEVEHVTTASLMGVRESRRIVGEYELNFDDYLARRKFPDQIAMFNKAVDIHVYDDSDEEYDRYYREFHDTGRLGEGESFGIPYGVLVPRGSSNLWVAGRCVSSDIRVHGSIRVQPAASMMGQAAGTAAVQSIRLGQKACELDTEELVHALRRGNARLDQEILSKSMTRNQERNI